MTPEEALRILDDATNVSALLDRLESAAGGKSKMNWESGGVSVLAGETKQAILTVRGPIYPYWSGQRHFDPVAITKAFDKMAPESIHVVIDSPGGSVYHAHTVYADLMARAADGVKITSEVRGIAFSAAFMLYLAGDERRAIKGVSRLMSHGPSTVSFVAGTIEEIRGQTQRLLAALESTTEMYIDILQERIGANRDDAAGMLSEDNYFSAEEGKKKKIVTSLVSAPQKSVKSTATAAPKPDPRVKAQVNSILANALSGGKYA